MKTYKTTVFQTLIKTQCSTRWLQEGKQTKWVLWLPRLPLRKEFPGYSAVGQTKTEPAGHWVEGMEVKIGEVTVLQKESFTEKESHTER